MSAKPLHVVAALAAALAGCCSTCPAPPEPANDTARRMVKNLRHYVKEECWSETYDLLSERSRDSQGYATFRLGAPGLTFPGTDVLVRDILINGEPLYFLSEFTGQKSKNEQLLIFQDNIAEGEDRRCRTLNFLLIQEGQPPRWALGLKDQEDRGIPICGE